LKISVNAGANEVVGAIIADFEDGVRHHVGDGDELASVLSRKHLNNLHFLASSAANKGNDETKGDDEG
jgi:hypothetical protein